MKPLIFISLFISILFYGCYEIDKTEAKIAEIDVTVKVSRFDREFANAKPEDLPELKANYPYLFPIQYPDSVWNAKLKDTIQIELFEEVGKIFPDFEDEKHDMTALFQHVKYYFPEFKIPKVITLTSEVQYANRVVLADSLLLIGLDNYLGADHKFYQGFQDYIAEGLDKKFMMSDIAGGFALKVVPRLSDRTFLANIIYHGKILYLKDKFLPHAEDAIKIGYLEDQIEWAIMNEVPMWRNFIEQEHLYSTDQTLRQRFLDPAPFSKFGLGLDNESPGRLGRYIGWQIVRAFMDKNEITLQQLLNIPAEDIFKKANYKPRN